MKLMSNVNKKLNYILGGIRKKGKKPQIWKHLILNCA